jgi:hypothetical protein
MTFCFSRSIVADVPFTSALVHHYVQAVLSCRTAASNACRSHLLNLVGGRYVKLGVILISS